MARGGDQFRSSDVTFWGIAALCCGGLAVLSANLAAVLPPNLLAGLHASRLEGATLNQLRAQVANLETTASQLRRDNLELASRFSRAEDLGNVVAQRVGALEIALPDLLETAGSPAIDPTATASIPPPLPATEVEGGAVVVQQTPLAIQSAPVAPIPVQPMPRLAAAPPRADGDSYGIALGPPVNTAAATDAWTAINAKVGTLLLGLSPVLASDTSGVGRYIVAGPLPGFAQARDLCGRLAPVGIACRPVPFVGAPLAP